MTYWGNAGDSKYQCGRLCCVGSHRCKQHISNSALTGQQALHHLHFDLTCFPRSDCIVHLTDHGSKNPLWEGGKGWLPLFLSLPRKKGAVLMPLPSGRRMHNVHSLKQRTIKAISPCRQPCCLPLRRIRKA